MSIQPAARIESVDGRPADAPRDEIVQWIELARSLGVGRVLVISSVDRSDARFEAPDRSVVELVMSSHDPARQQSCPFAMACLSRDLLFAPAEIRRAGLHQAVQHLARGGVLAVDPMLAAISDVDLDELGFRRTPDVDVGFAEAVVLQRSERTTVHDLMWDARSEIRRVAAAELARELSGTEPPLVVDTRSHTDRSRAGVIPGSIHVPRTVLEWHLDPANGYRHPEVRSLDTPLVIVCNGGYSSSLAAANLLRIGFTDVRDLIGGMRGWIQAGGSLEPPDHAHLDL
jgi:rhodanese-related sulfurtransferase